MITALLVLIAAILVAGILVTLKAIEAAARRIAACLKTAEAAIVPLVEHEDQERAMRSVVASGYGRDLLRQRLAERLKATPQAIGSVWAPGAWAPSKSKKGAKP